MQGVHLKHNGSIYGKGTASVPNSGKNRGDQLSAYLQQFIDAGQLRRWYRFNEVSGNLINYGNFVGVDGTVTSAAQGEVGKLGAREAYLFDGINDWVSCPAGVDNNDTTFTMMWLLKNSNHVLSTRLWGFGNTGIQLYCSSVPLNRLSLVWIFSGDNISLPIPNILPGEWTLIFITYNESTDRIARGYIATDSSGVSLVGTSPPTTGIIADASAIIYTIGARGVPDLFYNALIDEHAKFNTTLSVVQMNAIASIIFG